MLEQYTPGHSRNATEFMAVRSLQTHGAFIRPYLQPGMKILDCGCGPGGISAGLAEAVGSSGQVIGIDSAESQVAVARNRSTANLRFEVGSVYLLPFADNTFDLVFSHALFEHLAHPARGIQELLRVLRPGGIAGLCSPDWGGFIVSPANPRVENAISSYRALQEKNGGDTLAGRKLGSWLKEADFSVEKLGARYECYSDSKLIAEYLAIQLEQTGILEPAAALREWAALPWSLFAQAWVSAIGLKMME
jgi:ubiquinone/menaquinone biosynthesis C-methylase UbiE